MALGFKKRIRIAPGIHVNIGKTGASVRAGSKWGGVTHGTNGTRVSGGIPGTGLSYGKKLTSAAQQIVPTDAEEPKAVRSKWRWPVLIVGGLATGIAISELFLK